jgi:hypothetical protein
MTFQLEPRIYSLLLCGTVRKNPQTGGWIIEPFSEVSTRVLPLDLRMTVFAQIMAPPGRYDMAFHFFHTGSPERPAQVLPTRTFTVHEGKNVDFIVQIEARITQTGLHMLEARLANHHVTRTPLRIAGS